MKIDKQDTKHALAAHQNTRERDYWLNKLAGAPVRSDFPHTGKTTDQAGYKHIMDTMKFQVDPRVFSKLMALVNQSHHRLHIAVTAVLVLLIYKYTAHKDIIIGIPIYKQEVEGELINTVLAVRNQVNGGLTFKELLLMTAEAVFAANENQNYPIETLLYKLGMEFNPENFPLFNIAVLLENIHDRDYLHPIQPDMVFVFNRSGDRLEGKLEYNTAVYETDYIRELIGRFSRLLDRCVTDINIRLSAAHMLSQEEKKRLIVDFNDNRVDFPGDKTIYQWIEKHAENSPERIAIGFNGSNLNYRELNERANKLARRLRRSGIKQDKPVGILLERSPLMVESILAAWKAGGAYIPIDPHYPPARIKYILENSQIPVLLTDTGSAARHSFTALQGLRSTRVEPYLSASRCDIVDFDDLPIPDRSLVDYEKYNKYIGQALVKDSISIQATRGCPYKCAFCHKIWSKKHYVRSAGNIYSEVRFYYDMGVRRFSFVDDIFNFDKKNSAEFFQLIIKNGLDVQLFFPNGMRGDILTREYIDLIVEAGVVDLALALETGSPRLQKLINKNINLERLRENIEYFCEKYPHVILELFTMHGFPTETEQEAMMTMNFIKSLKWLHFPYIAILKIYKGLDMEKIALDNGISRESIIQSQDYITGLELPDSLPFKKEFTIKYQTTFLNDYFLRKERLLHVLPYQMKILTDDEIVQKYNSYLPVEITSFNGLLEFVGISKDELTVKNCRDKGSTAIPGLNLKLGNAFPGQEADKNALKVLLLELSQFFSIDSVDMQYNVVEAPLGLMYVMTHLKQQFGGRVNGKIAKSRIDFDNYNELKVLLDEFKPDVIGVRALSYYRNFLHKTVAMIRHWGTGVPIIAGGPYATGDYVSALQDKNIDLVVLGEGELTFCELVEKILENNGTLPGEEVLKEIAGIAFLPGQPGPEKEFSRDVILLDELNGVISVESAENLKPLNQMTDLAYIIYTSGSTGKPKGAMIEHAGMMNHMWAKINDLQLTGDSIIAQNAAHTFDISVWQFFAALNLGGKTVIYPDECVLAPETFISSLDKDRVTILEVVPSYLAVMLDYLDDHHSVSLSLNYLLVTGEAINLDLVRKWFEKYPGIKMVNAYGPTEASDDITHYIMAEPPGRTPVPIGKPVQNFNIYIVDADMNLCPPGIRGEICVSGVGVGRGYLNDGERTSRAFMEDPFREERGVRFYRTGDLGSWLPDGTVEFFGRKDHQVKIRGFRIELGEIETRLREYPGVKEAVVIDREDEGGNKLLCAYLVSAEKMNIPAVKAYLEKRLPGYMVPAHFVQLERIPLTANGKIDRKALPGPVRGSHAVVRYISPEVLDSIKETGGGQGPRVFPMTAPGKFLDSVVGRLEKEKSLLADYSRKTGKEYYLLSYPQKMIYFIEKKHSGTGCNNIVFFIRYPEDVDGSLLEEAINKVIFKHTALRLRMTEIEHESGIIPAQYPTAYRKVSIHRLDFSAGEDSEARVQGWLRKKGAEAFDFFDSDLFYFAYVKIRETESGCYMKIHNIVSDGLTFHILIKEIGGIYRDLKAGKRVDIKEAPSYLDFIADELAYFKSARARSDMKFYLEDMLPPPGEVTLSRGVIGGDSANVEADCVILGIPADLRRKIHEYRKQTKSSLYKIMLSALSVYISRALGRDEVVIGSLVNNRSHFKYIKTAGIFIHFLPLRIRIDGNMDFNGFVEKTGRYLDDIIANRQGYPFEILAGQLRECFGVDPGYFYNINLIGYPDLEGVVMERPFAGFEEAPFSLYVNRYNRDIHGVLEFEWIFRRGLFDEEEIRQIHGRLENILHDALDHPGKKLTEIEYLSPGESGLPVVGGEPLWVRGVRVDAGEIENALLGYNGIKEAAVVTAAVDEYGNMNRPLCGFVVADPAPGPAALQEYLSLKLPAHLVPSYFFRLEEMPLTVDGKVDRLLLSAVKPEAGPGKEHEEPRDRLETGLRQLWAEVMGMAAGDIGVNRSFFDLGGHSLTAIMLTARVHKVFNVRLPLAQVFRTPTVRGLAGFLRAAVTSEFVPVQAVEAREYYGLSSAQKRLYVLQRMQRENVGYNMPFVLALHLDLDIKRFSDSLKKIISRHESLRTSFEIIDEEPVQRIHTEVDFEVGYYDLTEVGNRDGDDGAGLKEKAAADIVRNFVHPFDLEQAPLLRVGLIKIEKETYIFVKDMHHIISDEISMGVFTGEAMALYAGEEVPPLKLQYKDYSQWQNHSLNAGAMKEQEAYWLKQFAGKIPEADLPCDYERSRVAGYRGDVVTADIGAAATGRLRKMAAGKGATLNMLLLTLFAVLLSKYTDQEDLVIGIPVSGRVHHDLGHIIGMFVNMLALRIYPNHRKRFTDLLEEVKECSIKAFDNRAYQFDNLIEKLKLKRSLDRHPLFDTVFQFSSAVVPDMTGEQPGMEIEHAYIKPYRVDDKSVTSRFDLSLNAVELMDKISYTLRYRPQLFKSSTIERMSLAYKKIVEQVIDKPGVELFNIEIINDDEIKEKETVDLDADSVRFNF
jgi:amino acid adenylation domain-containing protein